MNILDQILAQKVHDIQVEKNNFPLHVLQSEPYFSRTPLSLKARLNHSSLGIIAEIKRKSPSMGAINTALDPIAVAKMYEACGVAGISVLTDATYFGGSLEDLKTIRAHVTTPLLRKEFIIDEHQLLTAKAFGADCILLIAEALTHEQVKNLAQAARELKLEVLMEVHSEDQLDKLTPDVSILGVNNRDLKLQKTDLSISKTLFAKLPKDLVCITESGINTAEELQEMANIGYKGALIGTAIIGNENPATKLKELCSIQHKTSKV